MRRRATGSPGPPVPGERRWRSGWPCRTQRGTSARPAPADPPSTASPVLADPLLEAVEHEDRHEEEGEADPDGQAGDVAPGAADVAAELLLREDRHPLDRLVKRLEGPVGRAGTGGERRRDGLLRIAVRIELLDLGVGGEV